jgi:hypothetical protein
MPTNEPNGTVQSPPKHAERGRSRLRGGEKVECDNEMPASNPQLSV